jgi:hypothetical protein
MFVLNAASPKEEGTNSRRLVEVMTSLPTIRSIYDDVMYFSE